MTAIAAVGDDLGQVRAELRLDLRDDGRQGVAAIRVSVLAWAIARPSKRWSMVAIETLTPNSWRRWAFPLPMHSTSGACTEYTFRDA